MYSTIFHLSNHKSRDQSDYIEGWPLLTVETEANGESRSTYERGSFLVGSRRFKRVLSCLGLAALFGPGLNLFLLLPIQHLTSFLPIAQQAGQAVVPGRLSLSMCL
jgi:hypothetical protein